MCHICRCYFEVTISCFLLASIPKCMCPKRCDFRWVSLQLNVILTGPPFKADSDCFLFVIYVLYNSHTPIVDVILCIQIGVDCQVIDIELLRHFLEGEILCKFKSVWVLLWNVDQLCYWCNDRLLNLVSGRLLLLLLHC